MRNKVLVVVSLVAASILAGCGAEQHGAKGEPAIPTSIAPVTQANSLQIPLMAYEPTSQEWLVAAQAANELINQCLERFGAPGNIRAPQELQPRYTDPSRRYGLVSSEDAQYGYSGKPQSGLNDKRDEKQTISTQQKELIDGVTSSGASSKLKDKSGNELPEFGCGGEAWSQIDPHNEDGELLTKALDSATDSMQADSRFIELNRKWAQCMEGFGYKFSKRPDAGNSTSGASIARRVQVAKHDVECAQKVNYVGVANAIDTAYQRRYIDEHADAFAALAKHKDEMIKKANEVLGGGK